jgi:uncharacterized protein YegL
MNLRKERRKLHVALVRDESGSMASLKRETLSGLNEQLQELKKKPEIDTTITFVTFSGPEHVNLRYALKPLSEIKEFTDKDYNPDGMTAMYDGVAKCIHTISNEVQDDDLTNYLVLVVSDGQENSSKEFTSKDVAKLIQEKKDTKKWSINYIGANQDLSVISKDLNIDLNLNTLGYVSSRGGTHAMWKMSSEATRTFTTNVANSISPQSVNLAYFNQGVDVIAPPIITLS